jgi:hypothetical protein
MKSISIIRNASLAAALVLSGVASAATFETRAIDACALAVAGASHASHLDVVRFVDNAGFGNNEYWINADVSPAKKSYCRTRRGEVSQIITFDGHWSGTSPRRPDVAQAASSSAPSAGL